MDTDDTTPVSSATPDENSKIGQKCGKDHGTCIVKGEDGQTYKHISCCSEKGYCGLSANHCGKGCQSEFGACYSHHNVPVESSTGITITLTTEIESESTPVTESVPTTTEEIPITTESTTTHTKTSRTKSVPTTESTHSKSTSSTKSTRSKSTTVTESTPITESTFTTSHVKSTKSTTYITKTTTITIS